MSIDIETTALEPDDGQIIEFAAVIDDLKTPIQKLPTFRRLIRPDDGVFMGTPGTLVMNAEILREIGEQMKHPDPLVSCLIRELVPAFRAFLKFHLGDLPLVIAGKNFGGFDAKFLRAETNFFKVLKPHQEKRFRRDSIAAIHRANEIIAEYEEQGFSLTLRQLYYQHVARGFIPNTERSYKQLGDLISDARLIRHEEDGQTPIIFHLGDHDPSGIDMTRDLQDRSPCSGRRWRFGAWR